ncbi:MAG: AAA family ATPase [Bacteroidales bacterium]|nr:AAA family ATPase [Bacteroidales bacterium]
MKFQQLTIHNLASIQDVTIDFEAQPLNNSDVFLITGKTGAGKTTILDAICLALYADTPRMDGTKMEGETTSEVDSLKADDPRQLLRHDAGEGSATLTFIGNNDVRYRAEWSVARAHKKVNGKIRPKNWTLMKLDGSGNCEHQYTKDADIKAEIKVAVGLDFKQFCRTSMLAQGEFTKFLNSKDSEKAEILEKITGVDIYAKIGAKVFKETKAREEAYNTAKLQADQVQIMDQQTLDECRNNLKELDAQHKSTTKERDTANSIKKWLETRDGLDKYVQEAEQKSLEAQSVVNGIQYKEDQTLVNDWDNTAQARNWMEEESRAAANVKRQENEMKRLSDDFARLKGGRNAMSSNIEQLDQKIKKIKDDIAAQAERKPIYDQAQTIVAQLRTVREGKGAMKRHENELKERAETLKQLQSDCKTAQERAAQARQNVGQFASDIEGLQKNLDQKDLPTLRQQREQKRVVSDNVRIAKERKSALVEAVARVEKARQDLNARQESLRSKQEKFNQQLDPLKEAEVRMQTCSAAYDMQSVAVEDYVNHMRARLHVGDVCPVCQQKIQSNVPHQEEVEQLVSGLRRAKEQAEQSYKQLNDEHLKLGAEIKSEEQTCQHARRTIEEDKTVPEAQQKLAQACAACGINPADTNMEAALQKLEEETAKSSKELEAQIAEAEALENRIGQQRKQLDKLRKEAEKLDAAARTADDKVKSCQGEIETSKKLIETKQQEVQAAEQQCADLITIGGWQYDWHDEPQRFSDELTQAAKSYADLEKLCQQLENKYKDDRAELDHIDADMRTILSNMPDWQTLPPVGQSVEQLQQRVTALGGNVTKAQTLLDASLETQKVMQRRLNDFWEKHPDLSAERLVTIGQLSQRQIEEKKKELKDKADAALTKQTLLEEAKKKLNEHIKVKPQMSEADTLDVLTAKIEQLEKTSDDLATQRGAIQEKLRADDANRQQLGPLLDEVNRRREEYERWSRLNELIGDATGSKFRRIAQSYVLANLIRSANVYMRTLTDRYELGVEPGSFIITLADAYQGYATRSASTISGGESFLVSLSLALALSDIDNNLSADILFIDEGFGTLSGVPLQHAIQTLRSLHTRTHRHVGIISHVEELRERIPVQIQVSQQGFSSVSQVHVVTV